ncbi:MAG: SDR family oxidoreductase [Deltaproteobacteria bacterium]|nr:SDR family oxidoreductase [Deltaproteobacteria bacterium]
MDFTGKTAIVTGGANGIGKAVVEGIIKGGGTAVITDINEQASKAVQRELGNKVHTYAMDLSDPAGIRACVASIIRDLHDVDILINCAGIVNTLPFEEITDAAWEKVLRINLTGTFATCSAVYEHMKARGNGSIVNIASVAGKIGGGLLGTAAYATSKAGVIGLTKAIAREGGPFGIRCNAVCPSYTTTSMTQTITDDPEYTRKVLGVIPLGRGAAPAEIANMILFFASDLASFITGEIGDADGGITRDG